MINIEEALDIIEIRKKKIGPAVSGMVRDFFSSSFITSGLFILTEIETKESNLMLSFSLCKNEDVEVIEGGVVFNYLGISKEINIQSDKLEINQITELSNILLQMNISFLYENQDIDKTPVEIILGISKNDNSTNIFRDEDILNLNSSIGEIFYQEDPLSFRMNTDKGDVTLFFTEV